jgi:DNA-binding transcriptional ArsR family regulator
MKKTYHTCLKCDCCQCFQTMACDSRFKIFEYLKKKGKATVSSLVKFLGLRQPTVTFHLNQLKKRGLVKKVRVGREVYCQLHKKCDPCPLF